MQSPWKSFSNFKERKRLAINKIGLTKNLSRWNGLELYAKKVMKMLLGKRGGKELLLASSLRAYRWVQLIDNHL